MRIPFRNQTPTTAQRAFDAQRFVPPKKPGPQGNPDISWPSAPLDPQGRPFDLRGTKDIHSGERIAHTGPRIGTEGGSPTYFQSNRNQLAAKKNEAHIAHLTFPQDRGLKKEFEKAKFHEEKFAREHSRSIKREIASGHRDDYVPMQRLKPPSLEYQAIPMGPVISGPQSGRPIPRGFEATKVPANPAQPVGEFRGLEKHGNDAAAGSHRAPREDMPSRRPLHFDQLVRLDDMVTRSATALVNKPGRGNQIAYQQSLKVRGDYEKNFKKEIERERKSGAWMQSPIGANHPDYRQLEVSGGLVHMKDPVAGRRVPGSADRSLSHEAPGVSAYAHEPDLEALRGRLARLRGEEPATLQRGGMENPAPRRAGPESPFPRPENPLAKTFAAMETPTVPANTPASSRPSSRAESPEHLRPLRTSRGTQTERLED